MREPSHDWLRVSDPLTITIGQLDAREGKSNRERAEAGSNTREQVRVIDQTVSGEESIALGALRNEGVSYTDVIRGYYRVSASINHRM